MNFLGLILAAGGAFSIFGAVTDWDLFMESHKARFFVAIFGRDGARIFYGLLGSVLVVVGILIALGIITNAS